MMQTTKILSVPESAKGIPEATVSFRATLTATSNKYLVDRLPLEGFVAIHERSIHGECQFVTFMPDPEQPGGLTCFVSVPDAEFTFKTRV
jgi:hypothetical protein